MNRIPYRIQARDESEPTLAAGLLRARIPFAYNRDHWVGFTAYLPEDDACTRHEFSLLLRALAATATNGVIAEILPE